MPKIRVLVPVAGAGFAWSPGDVVDVDEKTARAWCDGERAERVTDRKNRRPRPPIESTVAAPPEDTALRSSE
jgi:hypothetical protein